jgi:hypothetical protein
MAASKKSNAQTEPGPSATAQPPTAAQPTSPSSEEALVLSYLHKHGLTEAASSLTKILRERSAAADGQESEEGVSSKRSKTSHHPLDYLSDSDERPTTGAGYDLDCAPSVALWGAGCPKLKTGGERDEARGYVEGFTSLITWVLSLGDDPAFVIPGVNDEVDDSEEQRDGEEEEQGIVNDVMEVDEETQKPNRGLTKLVQNALASASDNTSNPLSLSAKQRSEIPPTNNLLTPPSTKPELLSLSFPLMVHTYCELLSCSMPNTAR